MKKLENEQMEIIEAGGWVKCLAAGIGGYGIGALGGIEAAGVIIGAVAVANPVGLMVGLAVFGGVTLGIGAASAAC